ncbi:MULTISPECIES: hypothetical protein [Actinomadura]|uniref:hypothetical protein n=1 Tax=Actinomadura TaxID=1988 RepID=UPI0003F75B60|nr:MULTISPECIES: hypothetical protein [Actinomadura]RSN68555.1 hypothetical protein DMH08_10365 [Actinomadura sp. WAC 06369]
MTNSGDARDGYLRPALWMALAIGLVGNVLFSTTGMSLIGNAVFSLISFAAVVGLIVHHYRNRRPARP